MTEMETKADGYFTDDIYVPVYNNLIDPRVISSHARFFGFDTAPTDQPFNYGDFGCGLGTDVIMLAYAMPHGRFFGFDINTDQIGHARTLAAHLGLTNITFVNAAFADINADEIPPLDYAVNTGVISWVSKTVRAELIDAISRCISDTGFASVRYQTTPGSSDEGGFRYLLRSLLDKGETPQNAFHTLSGLISSAPKYDAAKDTSGAKLRSLKHEYISNHWHPVYPSEMMAAFAQSGFGLCGPFDVPTGISTKLSDAPIEQDELFLFDLYACKTNQGQRTDIFSKQTSNKNTDPKSVAQEGYVFRLPLPITPTEDDKLLLSQTAFSPNRACKPLASYLGAGLSGPMRQLAWVAYERTASVLTSDNPAPIDCPNMFTVEHNDIKDQFTLSEFPSWNKRTIVARNTGLILSCPEMIHLILSNLGGVPLDVWHDRLNTLTDAEISGEAMAKATDVWKNHWAPILAAHGVIKPLLRD